LKEIKRYLNIYFLFIKNCLIAQLEYRTNFAIAMLIECAFLFTKVLYIIVIFNVGVTINGLEPYEILMFIGSYTIITGFMDAIFFPNISRISQYVRSGELDLYITKPLSLQFIVSFRYFDFGLAIPNIIVGIVMVVVAWLKVGIDISLFNITGYIILSILGLIITYPVLMFPTLLSFWVINTSELNNITFALWDFNNMPMQIYGKVLQKIGVFLIPIFIITNFAPMFVMGLLDTTYIIWSIVAAILFNLLLRLFWTLALKSYSSASS
ncbi:MAG: ABC-2 family transporter protein, partial [Clostridiales bacterium]